MELHQALDKDDEEDELAELAASSRFLEELDVLVSSGAAARLSEHYSETEECCCTNWERESSSPRCTRPASILARSTTRRKTELCPPTRLPPCLPCPTRRRKASAPPSADGTRPQLQTSAPAPTSTPAPASAAGAAAPAPAPAQGKDEDGDGDGDSDGEDDDYDEMAGNKTKRKLRRRKLQRQLLKIKEIQERLLDFPQRRCSGGE